MNKIFQEISKLSKEFREMCYGLTNNKTEIEDAVQELMIYLLERPELVKKIYDNDGIKGIKNYGAVVLRRSIRSFRSPFYYKYKKYYTHIDNSATNVTYVISKTGEESNPKNLYNIPDELVENYKFKKLDKIDVVLGEHCNWYDKKIFEIYYSGETLDSLAKKTGISRNSLFTTIDKVRELLKEKLNE
jgi:hypothetical protein|tara:strand:- start:1220 stop:1783 length:564 start_codon:yes stop_codon:yes gene_type:complete